MGYKAVWVITVKVKVIRSAKETRYRVINDSKVKGHLTSSIINFMGYGITCKISLRLVSYPCFATCASPKFLI